LISRPAIRDLLADEKVRYLVAGAYNTAVGLLLYLLFFGLLQNSFHYMLLLLMNHLVGTLNSYLSYKLFVFRTSGGVVAEYLRFNLVHGIGIAANFLALPVLVELAGLSPFAAQGLIIAVLIVANFFLHKGFSFGLPLRSRGRHE